MIIFYIIFNNFLILILVSNPTENLVIELMIVVDSAFIKKHRDLYSVKLYLQTILVIMSNIYR